MASVDRYRVVGNPIAHSKSPEIHALFAEQTGHAISYDKHFVELDRFAEEAAAFFSSGGKGMNITVPFKDDAFAYADAVTKRAELAGAVNTLAVQLDGSILGDNTDGQGLVWDITERLGWSLKAKKVLVLGAGGAVKGVLYSLLEQKPAELIVANRTASKAVNVVSQFEKFGSIRAIGFDQVTDTDKFDIIINATSASLSGQLPLISESIFTSSCRVYDMVYADALTPFLRWAKSCGAQSVSDGLGMLIGQAAESFTLWTKKRPDIQASYEHFKSQL